MTTYPTNIEFKRKNFGLAFEKQTAKALSVK
jgi:hypothetical protein